MRVLTLAIVLTALVVGQTFAEPQRIRVQFKGSGYNSAANQFMEAPTYATIQTNKKGNDILTIEVDDPVWSDVYKAYMARSLRWEKNSVPDYIAAIDKYAQWVEIAIRDGDMITKEIAKVKTKNGRIRFQMHSGNAEQHYLVADFCAAVCLEDRALYFSYENAMSLRDALDDFGTGRLAVNPDIDSKYQ